ncbi:MAG: hypothetical protein OEM63_09245, partial [Gammaproteobacteria bacterium]|nr:hypothetical protein [Gammaproteobacteria bacterium]
MPAQFELIPTLTHAVSGPTAAVETSENTFAADESKMDLDGRPRSEIEQLVAAQRRQIADLEYRLEKSRMRQRGLDEEIKVRDEITTDINREIRAARKQLIAAAEDLESLNQKYLQMRAKCDAAEREVRRLRSTIERQGQGTSAKDSRIAELEQVAASAARELDDLRNYVDQRKAAWHGRDAEFAVLQAEMDQLRQENRELGAAALKRVADREDEVEDPSSIPAIHASELESLRKDNERFESYANELRIKLQDQIAATQESTSMRQKLEANLEVASGMITELSAELEKEKAASRDLATSNESLRSEFERETRQIRFELGAAQQTITEQDTLNQQLASDLIDNQGFRQALENHIGDIEEENARTVQKLEEKLAKAQARIGEQEHKMRVKDGAIADLMQELADQSAKLNFTGQLETALQRIDGYRPDQASAPKKEER